MDHNDNVRDSVNTSLRQLKGIEELLGTQGELEAAQSVKVAIYLLCSLRGDNQVEKQRLRRRLIKVENAKVTNDEWSKDILR
jgi:hypothetical protein